MKLPSPRSKELVVSVIVPLQATAVSEVMLTRSIFGGSSTSRVFPSGSGRISNGLCGVFSAADEMGALSQVRKGVSDVDGPAKYANPPSG